MKEELLKLVNELEVLNDTLVGVKEYYEKLEEHFKEPTDSNKLKLIIKNHSEMLQDLIDNIYGLINQ